MHHRKLLHRTNLIDPVWWRHPVQSPNALVVGPDGYIELFGAKLEFSDPQDKLPPGTEVVTVVIGRWWHCVLKSEWDAHEAALAAAREDRRERERRQLNVWRAEAEAFNAQITLPVRWDVGQKTVLSGLRENSNGTGRMANTVDHILLLEDMERGTLRRNKGDFLCTTSSGSNGKRWSTVESRCYDGEGERYAPKVSCKACLRLAGVKWIK